MKEELNIFRDALNKYSTIPSQQWTQIVDLIKIKPYEKKEHFISVDDQPDKFAFVKSGVFRVYCISDEGIEKTLSFRCSGQFIAPYTPVIFSRSVWYYIQALTPCEIYYITLSEYKSLANNHICWETLEKNYIIELFLEKEERERSLLLDDATKRYDTFVKSSPELLKHIQQNYIASYLGITPVSLSRLKAK